MRSPTFLLAAALAACASQTNLPRVPSNESRQCGPASWASPDGRMHAVEVVYWIEKKAGWGDTTGAERIQVINDSNPEAARRIIAWLETCRFPAEVGRVFAARETKMLLGNETGEVEVPAESFTTDELAAIRPASDCSSLLPKGASEFELLVHSSGRAELVSAVDDRALGTWLRTCPFQPPHHEGRAVATRLGFRRYPPEATLPSSVFPSRFSAPQDLPLLEKERFTRPEPIGDCGPGGRRSHPDFPPDAADYGVAGFVLMVYDVYADGTVHSWRVLNDAPAPLIASTVEWLRTCKFKPAHELTSMRASAVRIVQPFRYQFQR